MPPKMSLSSTSHQSLGYLARVEHIDKELAKNSQPGVTYVVSQKVDKGQRRIIVLLEEIFGELKNNQLLKTTGKSPVS